MTARCLLHFPQIIRIYPQRTKKTVNPRNDSISPATVRYRKKNPWMHSRIQVPIRLLYFHNYLLVHSNPFDMANTMHRSKTNANGPKHGQQQYPGGCSHWQDAVYKIYLCRTYMYTSSRISVSRIMMSFFQLGVRIILIRLNGI